MGWLAGFECDPFILSRLEVRDRVWFLKGYLVEDEGGREEYWEGLVCWEGISNSKLTFWELVGDVRCSITVEFGDSELSDFGSDTSVMLTDSSSVKDSSKD